MTTLRGMGFGTLAILFALVGGGCSGASHGAAPTVVPATMTRSGSVDPRFQSYNVEMLEVTGGRFWKPYAKAGSAAAAATAAPSAGSSPVGMDPNIYSYRPPLNLSNPRLVKLAAALGPAYVRVSGTWANTTYFQDSNAAKAAATPKGFGGVLTRPQWKAVIEFAKAVKAGIVTSVAISSGTRNSAGTWAAGQARQVFADTRANGGSIAATEFMNEPTYANMGGAPQGYDAADYGRDVAAFHAFLKQTSPGTIFLGPGSVGEGGALAIPISGMLKSEDLLAATGLAFDIFSYHYYGAASQRCASMGKDAQTTAVAALSNEWLSRADTVHAFYAGLRDKFDPGKPMWITEMADSACGGSPWASTFLDVFRYLDQHARLAQQGVQVIFHNTLASSDYGLLDENTFEPRPNYWAALLWRRLMGDTVLNPGPQPDPNLHVYAQCLPDQPGGVTVLAINLDRATPHSLDLASASQRYTLSATQLQDASVLLNGQELKLGTGDALPALTGEATPAGPVTLAPASITFLAIAEANNPACRQ